MEASSWELCLFRRSLARHKLHPQLFPSSKVGGLGIFDCAARKRGINTRIAPWLVQLGHRGPWQCYKAWSYHLWKKILELTAMAYTKWVLSR